MNFTNECKRRANANRLAKITIDDTDIQISNSDNLKSFTIDSGCYVDGSIIGTIYVKCLTGEFVALPENIDLINRSISAHVGVKYDNLTTEYVNLGKYIVEKPKDEKTINKCKITAYDYLYTNLDNKYECGINYDEGNKTLKDLYIDVCNQLNLIPLSTTFLNSDIPIIANPFVNGEKNRLVLQTIGKISCSFITIDNDKNMIDLSWLNENEELNYIFETNDYVTLEGGSIQYGPINSVTIKNSQIDAENVTTDDEISIAENGEHSVIINEDYILYNAELRQQAIIKIFDRLNGLKYFDSKLITYYGKPFLKIGSKVRIYIDENNYFDTYILKHQFTYDGTFYSVIESPVLTEQEIKTKQNISLAEKLANTQIEINKQKVQIEMTASKTETIEANVYNNYQDLNKKFDGYAPVEKIVSIENSVKNIQNDTYTKTEINTKLTDGSVTKVFTTSGTFSDDGLTIEKTNAPTKGNFNEKGITVLDATGSTEKELLFAGYDNELNETVVRADNIYIKKYFVMGSNTRLEDYEDGTGVFDI